MSTLKLFLIGFLILVGISSFGFGEDKIEKLSYNPPRDMLRADLYVWRGTGRPEGVLVLTPGTNGNGGEMIRNPVWQNFAREHHLAMIGVSFASEDSVLMQNRGYYYTFQESGAVLLKGIRDAFHEDLPVVLFGFSAGAFFTSRFVEWKPERVITWCAYSAGWWDEPKLAAITPPGIVACGEEDPRFGASLMYFKQGRAVGRPWLWIEVPKSGHSCDKGAENLARDFFDVIIKGKGKLDPAKDGIWVDIDRLTQIDATKEPLSMTAWLPDAKLYEMWVRINKP